MTNKNQKTPEQLRAIIDSTAFLWQHRHYDQKAEDNLIEANKVIFSHSSPLPGSWKQLKQMIRYLEWDDDPFDLGIDKQALSKLICEHDYYHRLLGRHAAYVLKLVKALPFPDESSFILWKIDKLVIYRQADSGRINFRILKEDIRRLKTLGCNIGSPKMIAKQWLDREIFQLYMARDLPAMTALVTDSAACEWRFYHNLSLMDAQAEIDRLEKKSFCRKIILGNLMCAPKTETETEKLCYSSTLYHRLVS